MDDEGVVDGVGLEGRVEVTQSAGVGRAVAVQCCCVC